LLFRVRRSPSGLHIQTSAKVLCTATAKAKAFRASVPVLGRALRHEQPAMEVDLEHAAVADVRPPVIGDIEI
jgi:hypothetical protein